MAMEKYHFGSTHENSIPICDEGSKEHQDSLMPDFSETGIITARLEVLEERVRKLEERN